MSTTKIKFATGALSQLDHTAIDGEIATLVQDGVTDGTKIVENGYVIRVWTTSQAADNWVTYINTAFQAKPIDVIVTA